MSRGLNLTHLKTLPLADRRSLTTVEQILVDPASVPPRLSPSAAAHVATCARRILEARGHDASVILMYGAHLIRNGSARILTAMMDRGWITHLATNGAGTIHDWEYAWLGRSTESVEENVATGTFGSWEETGRNIHLALHAGAVEGLGYGEALGRFIAQDGATLPTSEQLRQIVLKNPASETAGACADLLHQQARFGGLEGRIHIEHRWKEASILAQAFLRRIPVTVHPGIGYDIITNHPHFCGAVIGRTAGADFRTFTDSVNRLDHGVLMSVGSAIMAPQVFEKSLSCVHNLRFQAGRSSVRDHSIFVVDLQDGGNWDWKTGEPPKNNPAYYLRFCKSFSRMGGVMEYLQMDNLAFVHNLYNTLDDLSCA